MNLKKWMSALPDDTPVAALSLPGTHNSSSAHIPLGLICRCQKLTVPQQLEIGVRFIDIRLEMCKNGFKSVHSVIDCKRSAFGGKLYFREIFASVCSFLDENPSETVLLLLSKDDGKASGEKFFDRFFKEFIMPFQARWYCQNRLPLLSECRGKIVLLSRVSADTSVYSDSNSGLNIASMHKSDDDNSGAAAKFEIPSLRGDYIAAKIVLQDIYMLSARKKWSNALLPCLSSVGKFDGTLHLSYASTAGGCLMPCFNAKYINRQLLSYRFDISKYYGFIPIDFINRSLSEKIISLNF